MTLGFFKRAVPAALLVAALSSLALAQSLQRLSVTGFTLSADTLYPSAQAPFHVIVTLRLSKPVSEVRNLQLPLLAGLQVLGDTRATQRLGAGTLYREVLTLSAQTSGTVSIAPATLDAIDARSGKPVQYATNPLVLHVAAATPSPARSGRLGRVLTLLGLLVVLLGVFTLLRARRAAAVPPPPVPRPQPAAEAQREPSDDEIVREALALLEEEHSRAGAVRARELLRRMVGARDGETLADVMKRLPHRSPRLLPVMPALERAAFTDDDDLGEAIARALDELRRLAR